MTNDLLVHATGLFALALNMLALVRTCERALRIESGISGLLWALNNLLLGAHAAAALTLVSAGRTATSVATMRCGIRVRWVLFMAFAAITVVTSAVTWDGWPTVFVATASMLSTYAMFYLRGRALRWSMLAVSALWMHNAWCYQSWEQVIANLATAAAALFGLWRIGRSTAGRTGHHIQ